MLLPFTDALRGNRRPTHLRLQRRRLIRKPLPRVHHQQVRCRLCLRSSNSLKFNRVRI